MTDHALHSPPPDEFPPELIRLRALSLVVGLIGWGLCILGYFVDKEHFFRSYLFAFLFWTGLTVGSLVWVMISHMTGGGWGVVNRRFGEAAFMNLPLMLLLFLPLMLGLAYLFPWAPDAVGVDHTEAVDAVLQHRAAWYNPTMFLARNVAIFIIWILFALAMRGGSLQLDKGDNPRLRRRLRLIAAPGVLVYFVLVTSFAMDFILSRETNWYSTITGFILAICQGATAMSFIVLMVCYFADRQPLKDVLTPQHLNDLGNLLLTLVILWTYLNVAQLLVIWQGNTQEDIGYYTHRGLGIHGGGWGFVALALLIFHFFVPFFLLLMRGLKRKVRTLAKIAIWLLIMRIVDTLWLTAPSGPHRNGDGGVYWTDIVTWIAFGGIWMFFYLLTLARRPLLPQNASDQPEIIAHGAHPSHA